MDRAQTLDNDASATPSGDNSHVLGVIRQAERELRQLIEEREKAKKHIGTLFDVIRQTERELRQLIEEREKAKTRIGTLKQTIVGLADLFGDGIVDAALLDLVNGGSRQRGLTRACRTVLMEAGRPMSARDVCDEIQRTVPALLAHHKDPMKTINTILGRLVYYGEATGLPGDRGQRAWLWAAEHKSRSIAPDGEGSRPTA